MRRRYVPIAVVAAIVGGLTVAWALPSGHLPGHVSASKLDTSVSWNTSVAIYQDDCRATQGGNSPDPSGPSGPGTSTPRSTVDIADTCASFGGSPASLNIAQTMQYDDVWTTLSATPNAKPNWKIQSYTITPDAGSDPITGNLAVVFQNGVCGEVPDGTSNNPATFALHTIHAGNYAFSVTIDLVPSTAWSAGACPTSF